GNCVIASSISTSESVEEEDRGRILPIKDSAYFLHGSHILPIEALGIHSTKHLRNQTMYCRKKYKTLRYLYAIARRAYT
uniref:Uncharacterized protein n=1 Tax=Romanomermis culicivorax TaxID=13658 RepID=A0A915HSF8_ROMCU